VKEEGAKEEKEEKEEEEAAKDAKGEKEEEAKERRIRRRMRRRRRRIRKKYCLQCDGIGGRWGPVCTTGGTVLGTIPATTAPAWETTQEETGGRETAHRGRNTRVTIARNRLQGGTA
jgi:hypothetical protein